MQNLALEVQNQNLPVPNLALEVHSGISPTLFLLGTGLTGFEPATSAVTGRCSNRLNYSPNLVTFSILLHQPGVCQPFFPKFSNKILKML